MSTPKKNMKKPTAEVTETGDGTTKVVGHRALTCDKDGNVHEATPEEMANAKAAHITIASKGDKGIDVFATYDCHIMNYGNGNIGLAIQTSDTLEDTEIDNPNPQEVGEGKGVKNAKITLVGRGNPLGAAFALVNCYRAYGTPFGQEFSHRLVRMELDKDTKTWYGLFVPAMSIATM